MEYYLIAFIIDLIVGDPHFLPHPIKFIGNYINLIEKVTRKIAKTSFALKIAGVFLLCSTILVSMAIVYIPLQILKYFGANYYIVGVIYFSYSILSTKCLKDEALKVKEALEVSLEAARKQVAFIVGRDTNELKKDEIIKATIETVAENTTDGIIAPLLFLFLGGPILAMAYKGVSTLDSMVGYKNDKYIDYGWASAKMDDILNFIPARIAGFVMVFASFIVNLDIRASLKILLRDNNKHASPNSAWTEAAAAGALNIQLGGTHTYSGKEIYKPTIGDEYKSVDIADILEMNRLMISTSCLFMIFSWLMHMLISYSNIIS
ncbi:cobalamin biosynthesis protein CobD [Alkalibaculum sp. M08DMB]|uniref:Cobalamin biosynthesis protein CobD n=1 Tax=Alkalibaculum sporogenes TaxID=2655001 RepID=A0A6A7KBA2_9FIRM|nr:adenosylcobinamide-phosphate synthase CbiB [Alkalibaculum sporogenes]MPW26293.1 cobalamin biosynthesis protein CobD [Alkalibaculum sporogenes]